MYVRKLITERYIDILDDDDVNKPIHQSVINNFIRAAPLKPQDNNVFGMPTTAILKFESFKQLFRIIGDYSVENIYRFRYSDITNKHLFEFQYGELETAFQIQVTVNGQTVDRWNDVTWEDLNKNFKLA